MINPNPADIGQRVQRLRHANGLSQADLADHAGIPAGVVSMVEHGRQSLEAGALDRVANALACTTDYLTGLRAEPVSTRPWLRAYADAPKRTVDKYVSDTETAIDTFEALGLAFYPESLPVFGEDLNDEGAIEDFAADVRRAAGLDDGDVVGNCIRRTERLGVVVLPMDDELGRHLGLSLRVNTTPVIRVSRPRLSQTGDTSPPGDRQRFTVAHELGHLTLHATTPPPASAVEARLIEQQAHRFAGAFLAPAEPLLADLGKLGGRVTLSTLADLKKTWGVAIKMLVVRLRQLGQIDDNHARSLYKQISARKWNTSEPVHVGHEHAIWLDKALTKAKVPTSNADGAAGLAPRYLHAWLGWEPQTPEIKNLPDGVIPLQHRRERSKVC
ncbi:helix-turn-helix domain-containing protein [Janibacter hoylei]|uniref:helix-turn-helix domain-containing protein n=1 Tax=Janibacter hoylei TaxID=364298 RepID=UPI0018643FA2|nr:XRE family transcriptional regulator [Janibacter hoylei]MCT1617992.1 XRE family transcriptional regulator [Janibacter hoylei]MCT2292041.1 XRE family transcriptional regulator [Janibacter hoylei]